MPKVVILHTDVPSDASADEQDTLLQARTIAEALLSIGCDPVMLPLTTDLNAATMRLGSLKPDAVFNLVETLFGRGSMVYFATALLDYLRIPYTGCRTDAMFLTSNKPLAKQILCAAGLPTPPWFTADGLDGGITVTDTYILKASWEDASVGLDDASIIRTNDPHVLQSALLRRKLDLGMDCFAEAFIAGREFNIALLTTSRGVRILPPSEILFLDYPPDKLKVLDYRAKWVEDSFEYDNTRRSLDISPQDAALVNRLQDIALACWDLFGLRGYARVDFRVDEQGNPFVLEINANPCLSPDAGFAAALEKASIEYTEAIDHIIQDALKS